MPINDRLNIPQTDILNKLKIENGRLLAENTRIQTEHAKIQTEFSRTQAENAGLKGSLAERDNYIGSLSKEKIDLANKVAELQNAARVSSAANASLTEQLKATESTLAQRDAVIAEKDQLVKSLQDKISQIQAGMVTDKNLLAELETTRLRCQRVETELQQSNLNLAQLRNEHVTLKSLNDRIGKDYGELSRIVEAVQQEKNSAQQELSVLKQRLQAAFSTDHLADYLTKTIDAFNSQVNTSDAAVNYVINGMDMELKASVGRNDQNQMILAAPDLTQTKDQGLSTLKISIRSVPK